MEIKEYSNFFELVTDVQKANCKVIVTSDLTTFAAVSLSGDFLWKIGIIDAVNSIMKDESWADPEKRKDLFLSLFGLGSAPSDQARIAFSKALSKTDKLF